MAKNKKAKKGVETARWGGHKFTVSPKKIIGFDGLQIHGACEVESKKKNGQLYAARKYAKPTEVTMTAHLYAQTGCDVRKTALKFVEEAKKGKNDYCYIGSKKLFTYKILLTDATVKEIEIAHNKTWIKADVQLTFEQTGTGGTSLNKSSSGSSGSSGSGGGGSYSNSGSYKQSVNTSSTTTTGPIQNLAKKFVSGVDALAQNIKDAQAATTKTAVNTASKLVSNAKKYSSTKKTGGGGGLVQLAATR